MPKFQTLTATINLGADRDQQVVRGTDNPITFPESLILRTLHGGDEHVHSLLSFTGHPLGEDRSHEEERDRLKGLYGEKIVEAIFPTAMLALPVSDPRLPSMEEAEAARAAAEEAAKKVRAKRKADAPAEAPVLPSIDNLPTA